LGLEATAAEAKKENLIFAFNSPVLQKQAGHCTENVCRSCVVSVNGDVGPCVFTSSTLLQDNGQPLVHMFQNRLEPCYPQSFGNIAHESLTRIWGKKAYHQFRNLHDPEMTIPGKLSLLPQSCRTCHKKEV